MYHTEFRRNQNQRFICTYKNTMQLCIIHSIFFFSKLNINRLELYLHCIHKSETRVCIKNLATEPNVTAIRSYRESWHFTPGIPSQYGSYTQRMRTNFITFCLFYSSAFRARSIGRTWSRPFWRQIPVSGQSSSLCSEVRSASVASPHHHLPRCLRCRIHPYRNEMSQF